MAYQPVPIATTSFVVSFMYGFFYNFFYGAVVLFDYIFSRMLSKYAADLQEKYIYYIDII